MKFIFHYLITGLASTVFGQHVHADFTPNNFRSTLFNYLCIESLGLSNVTLHWGQFNKYLKPWASLRKRARHLVTYFPSKKKPSILKVPIE
jgi:hypothetical protein